MALSLLTSTALGQSLPAIPTDTAGLFDTETLTIRINQPPTQPTVSITPDPAVTTDTLTCTPSGSTDPDGQSIGYGIVWALNGTPTSYVSSSLSSE